jgi:hypothetical protein
LHLRQLKQLVLPKKKLWPKLSAWKLSVLNKRESKPKRRLLASPLKRPLKRRKIVLNKSALLLKLKNKQS